MRENINIENTLVKLYEAAFWLQPWTTGNLGTDQAKTATEHIEKAIRQIEIIIKAQNSGWVE